jgi:hypothetical protein
MAICSDEATIVLCSRLADTGFRVRWARTVDVESGKVELEDLIADDTPDIVLYDVDDPVDESLLMLTVLRALPGMDAAPVVAVRGRETGMPPLDTPGIVAVLTRPCDVRLAGTVITTALRDRYDEAA